MDSPILKPNISAKRSAVIFAARITTLSKQNSAKLITQFLNTIMDTIDLDYQLDIKEIINLKFNIPIEICTAYEFTNNIQKLRSFDLFFKYLCQDICNNVPKNSDDQDYILCFMEILLTWITLLEKFANHRELGAKLNEPFARICVPLINGVNEIRKAYGEIHDIVNIICPRFLHFAFNGIYYRRTHQIITETFISLIENNFTYLVNVSKESVIYFYKAFEIKDSIKTRLNLLECLCRLLQNETTPNQMLVLTDFLICNRMLRVFYAFINERSPKAVVLKTIELIHLLQGLLPSVDCFKREFVEKIFKCVFHHNKSRIEHSSANLYITLMRRQFEDNFILKHIMEQYMSISHKENYNTKLKMCIDAFWTIFPLIQSIQDYFKLLEEKLKLETRAVAVHFAVAVFTRMCSEIDLYIGPIEKALIDLKILIKTLQTRQIERGILMQFYKSVDLEKFQIIPNFQNIIEDFEDYAVDNISNSNDEYPLMHNIFNQFSCFHSFTQNWYKLELIGNNLYCQYRALKIANPHSNEVELSSDGIKNFRAIFKKFSVFFTSPYFLSDEMNDLLIDLEQWDFFSKVDIYLEMYAISTHIEYIKTMSQHLKSDTSRTQYITNRCKTLEEHLLQSFINSGVCGIPVFFIKTIFLSLVDLYRLSHLKIKFTDFNEEKYQMLIDISVKFIFHSSLLKTTTSNIKTPRNESMHSNSLRILEYQRSMLKNLILLQQVIKLQSNYVSNICIYYSLKFHEFNSELEQLLVTISKHSFTTFSYIIPFCIYNLNTLDKPSIGFTQVQSAVKSYKKLIESHALLDNRSEFKIHIIEEILKIIHSNMSATISFPSTNDRLIVLKSLNVLIEDLILPDNLIDLLNNHLDEINKFSLTKVESSTLEAFKKLIQECKSM